MKHCTTCQYDWVANPAKFRVELRSSEVADGPLQLRCPACAATLSSVLSLNDLGVVRDAVTHQLYQWKDAPETAFSLSDVELVDPSNAVFGHVPQYSDGETTTVPTLPVRPAYLSLVDLDAFEADRARFAGRIEAHTGRYVALVPLKGRAPYPVTCGVVGEGLGGPPERTLDDVDLTVWPRVRSRAWHTFIVSATYGDKAKKLLGDGVEASFFVGGDDPSRPAELVRCNEIPFVGFERQVGGVAERVAPKTTRIASVTRAGRPTWVALTGRKPDSGEAVGGLFQTLTAQNKIAAPQAALRVGLDFGTSNTCMAFERVPGDATGTKRVLPARDLNEYLARSNSTRTLRHLPASQYHPAFPQRGFGEDGEVVPSELVFRWDASAVLGGTGPAAQPESWIPGLDCGICGNDVDWSGTRSAGVTESRLKWGKGHRVGAADALSDELRKRLLVAYLKTLMVYEAALYLEAGERLEGATPPAQLSLFFGFPGNFPEVAVDLRRALTQATVQPDPGGPAETVRWGLAQWCDIATDVQEEVDEAQAASRAAKPLHGEGLRAGFVLELLVDIGGGSTDVALTWKPTVNETDPARGAALEMLTSMRYAGEDAVDALFGLPEHTATRTIAPGLSREAVRSSIRMGGSAQTLLDTYKASKAIRRIETFYLQLAEWLARVVSAQVLAGHFAEVCASTDELSVRLVPLGNGWGLARLQTQWIDPLETLGEAIERRVIELLRAHQNPTQVKLHVRAIEGIAPKQAVAVGLLEGGGTGGARRARSRDGMEVLQAAAGTGMLKPKWRSRSIIGVPVRIIEPGSDAGEDRTLPWTASVQDGAYHPNEHGAPIPERASATWDADLFVEANAALPENLVDRTTMQTLLDESQHVLERSTWG